MRIPIIHPIWKKIRQKVRNEYAKNKQLRELRTYKYAHIMNNGIHTVCIIKFINKYFNPSEHAFIFPILKEETKRKIEIFNNIYNVDLSFVPFENFDKVVVHGLFNPLVTGFFYKKPKCLNNTYWFIWGGDLYCTDSKESKFVKKNFAGILTSFDYEIYKDKFGEKTCFDVTYPHEMSKEDLDLLEKQDCTNILVNNSADETTLEMLDILSKFKDQNINVYTILAYKSSNQSDVRLEIMKKGYEIFGLKFKPMINFLPKEEYARFLSNIDIYISNQNRQQGNGNATFICSIGGKIFTKSDTTVYKKYNSLGIKYFDTYTIPHLTFQEFVEYNENVKKETILKLTLRMSDEQKKNQWNSFFKY